jgi:hypothetical protein
MWVQEQYSLYPSEWRRRHSDLEATVKFGSIRAIRSTASHFWIWDLLLTQPDKLTLGFKDRPTMVHGCSPTDEIGYTFFMDGMRRRAGDNPKPSAVLLLHHILWMANYFDELFSHAPTCSGRVEACRAALTLVLAFLAWLRAMETFGLRCGDVNVTEPPDSLTVSLPFGVGVIQLILLAQTKSSQAASADVIVAYTSASGLSPGNWLRRLRALLRPDEQGPEVFLIAHPDGHAWTSHFFGRLICILCWGSCDRWAMLISPSTTNLQARNSRRRSMALILSDALVALSRLRNALRLPATPPLRKLWNTVAGV